MAYQMQMNMVVLPTSLRCHESEANPHVKMLCAGSGGSIEGIKNIAQV